MPSRGIALTQALQSIGVLVPVNFFVSELTEAIVNGGFEDDTTGWTFTPPAVINTTYKHSGLKSAKVAAVSGAIEQTFSSPILKSLISSFKMWVRVWETFDWTFLGIQLFYSDSTNTIDWPALKYLDLNWHEFNVKPYLTLSEKSLEKIKFIAEGRIGMHTSIDDVSLKYYQTPVSEIILKGKSYADGESGSIPIGTFNLSATVDPSHVFDHWASTGGITITDPNSQNTTAIISGAGTITLHTSQ